MTAGQFDGHRIEAVMLPTDVAPSVTWDGPFSTPAGHSVVPSPIMSTVGIPDTGASIRWNTGFYGKNVDAIVAADDADETSSGGGVAKDGISAAGVFVGYGATAGDKVTIDVTDMVRDTIGGFVGNPQAILNLLVKGAWKPAYVDGVPQPYGWFNGQGESESFLTATVDTGDPTSPPSLSFHSMNSALESILVEQAVVETRKSLGVVETRLSEPPKAAWGASGGTANQYIIIPTTLTNQMRDFLADIDVGEQVEIRNSSASVIVGGRTYVVSADGTHTYRGYSNGRVLLQPGSSGALFTFRTGGGIGTPHQGFVMQNQFAGVPILSRETDTSQGTHNIIVNNVVDNQSGTTSLANRGVTVGSMLYMDGVANNGFFTVERVDYSNPSQEIIYVEESITAENSNATGQFVTFALLDDLPRLEIEYWVDAS